MSADAPLDGANPDEASKQEVAPAGGLWEQIGTIGLAIAIALGVRAFVVEPFRIPSGSMFPTLLVGDHLFVNKFVYGARVPWLGWRLPAWRDPERGEVVVFEVAKDGATTLPATRRPEEELTTVTAVPRRPLDTASPRVRTSIPPRRYTSSTTSPR